MGTDLYEFVLLCSEVMPTYFDTFSILCIISHKCAIYFLSSNSFTRVVIFFFFFIISTIFFININKFFRLSVTNHVTFTFYRLKHIASDWNPAYFLFFILSEISTKSVVFYLR